MNIASRDRTSETPSTPELGGTRIDGADEIHNQKAVNFDGSLQQS